jgi:hypothetical protein
MCLRKKIRLSLETISEYGSLDLDTPKRSLQTYIHPHWMGNFIPILDPPESSEKRFESFDTDLEGLSGRTGEGSSQVQAVEAAPVLSPCIVYPGEEGLVIDMAAGLPVHETMVTVEAAPIGPLSLRLHRLVSVVAIKRSEIFKYLTSAVLVSGVVGYFVNQIPSLRS